MPNGPGKPWRAPSSNPASLGKDGLKHKVDS